jgi:carboxyl-terminal processing protease
MGWLVLACMTSACAEVGPSEPEYFLDFPARAYLQEALDVVERNSIKRYEIDWEDYRAQAYLDAAGARDPADTYPAIISALERLGDRHSFFSRPGEGESRPVSHMPRPRVEALGPRLGYIEVPAFSGGGRDARDLAARYHGLTGDVENPGEICGWLVDVRGNTGGNMWPMIAGVGPILGESTLGYFVDADGEMSPWFYEDGQAGLGDLVLAEVDRPLVLERGSRSVAVLTDSLTASSGEAVAIAFRGRDGTRSFGEATWGLSTANSAFPLSDGAVMVLTVATMADRLGNVYGGALVPDEVIRGGNQADDPDTDRVLARAVEWLRAQPCT